MTPSNRPQGAAQKNTDQYRNISGDFDLLELNIRRKVNILHKIVVCLTDTSTFRLYMTKYYSKQFQGPVTKCCYYHTESICFLLLIKQFKSYGKFSCQRRVYILHKHFAAKYFNQLYQNLCKTSVLDILLIKDLIQLMKKQISFYLKQAEQNV